MMAPMKTKTVLIIIACFSALFIGMTLLNVFRHTGREYTVISFPEFNACYLYGKEYKVKITENGFDYKAGSNSGKVRLKSGEMDSGLRWVTESMGEFEASYMKDKNDRIVEYKLDSNTYLRDDFNYIKNGAINLMPYRSECELFLQKFSKKIEIRFNRALL